ncbi:MAG: lipopolysaccharide kinase InaA family protein [Planctomycetota bacterium]
MEKTVFTGSWQQFFAGLSLVSFDDLFSFSQDETINRNTKRDVSMLTFSQGGESKVFFRKRFFKPHFKDMLFAWRSFGSPISQAKLEWQNAHLLLENAIETYRPVCYGERTKFGIERKSFFITEKLAGKALSEFVCEKWPQLTQRQKEKIIVPLGKFIRRIHDAQISLPDLYIWHVFIKERPEPNKYDFAVIDLHRMEHDVRCQNKLIKNLGRLHHSMVDKYFDDRLKELLIESYAGDDWQGGSAEFVQQVKKFSDVVSAKRNPKPY